MNLGQLWSGNDYAYYEFKGRGEVFRSNAQRIRVVRAYKKQQFGNERQSGFAEVLFLKDDGTPLMRRKYDPDIRDYVETEEPVRKEVRARDIAMHWDEYADEREHREAERLQMQRKREEAAAKEAESRTRLLDAIVDKFGISRELVTSIDDYTVRINRPGLEKELNVNE